MCRASLMVQMANWTAAAAKSLQSCLTPPAVQETRVSSLGQEDPLEKGMAVHSSILVWRIPRTEEPGGQQFMGSQRVGQYVNCELADVQAGFRKGRGTREEIANICWIIEKAREFPKNIYFCFIDYLTVRNKFVTRDSSSRLFLKRQLHFIF